MRGRITSVTVAAALTATCLALAGCTATPAPHKTVKPLAATPVALRATVPHAMDTPIRVGVVFTSTSAPGQGSDWLRTASSAEIAAYRFRLGGVRVEIDPVDDHGTSAGSAHAVDTLAADHVAGVVMATTGTHMQAGITQARQDGLPVILTHAGLEATATGPGVWSVAPTGQDVDDVLSAQLSQDGASSPFVITADGQDAPGVAAAATAAFPPAGPARQALAATIAKDARTGKADAVVLTGSASAVAGEAALVEGISDFALPVLATPTVRSPVFADQLVKAGGNTALALTTAGTATGDAAALSPTAAGGDAAAFYQAVRLAAADSAVPDVLGGSFAADAPYVGTAGSNAVVALVRAAVKAGSTTPQKVADTLDTLRLGGDAGIVGPTLDFRTPQALPASAVVALHSTAQNPGVRSVPASATVLFWIPGPATGAGTTP